MKKLPSLTEMEHITSKEFGENMDAILDRITDEDIALIIDHNSKCYVLCPASWFDLRELKHLELMVRNAVRFVVSVELRSDGNCADGQGCGSGSLARVHRQSP